MTEKILLDLTLDELKLIDKYIELNGDTRKLFDKIRSAYIKTPRSPIEEAYKVEYGEYPATTKSVSFYRYEMWTTFQKGYDAGVKTK